MAISLQKNASVSLAKEAGGSGLSKIALGVGWDAVQQKKKGGFFGGLLGGGAAAETEIDLDASCIAFDGRGSVVDLVWFQKLASDDGSIRHSGDNLTGEGDGDDETISIDLARLPATIETLVLTVNSFRGQTFNEVENAFGRVVDLSTNRELARFDITDAGTHTGIILASLKKAGGEWVFKALGERTSGRTAQDLSGAARGLI
ncbi:TerD family protein [Sphingomonas sp. PAMC26645]|uniref:TerD family protein n=1 Tax=Sphingomonas sp. PAMC26645 TaxID=2565555 RepID=UPI00109E0855|nr:TerD family protein [Sphingomonas sp. PAMC26645]QCB42570.1 TerD family protein [Sphingomonas sp. PAMC26645]